MTYEQVRDVLKAIKAFHRELCQISDRVSEETHDERLEFLMDVVRRHETDFAEVLDGFEDKAAEGVLNTWLQYTPTDEIQSALKSAHLADADDLTEVAEVVWEFEKALTDLYRQLAESTSVPRVEELFTRLLEREESKTGRYAWSLEDFQTSPVETSAEE